MPGKESDMRQEASPKQDNIPFDNHHAAKSLKHAEFAPPYPNHNPDDKELDPLVVSYTSVCPPVVSDGQNEIKLPQEKN